MSTTNYRDYIYTAADMATLHVEYDRYLKASPGIKFGLPCIDRCVIPARGGNLIAFAARPGHGKTSMMARWARDTAYDIVERGMAHQECVVYITLEQPAEELEGFFSANRNYTASDYAWGRANSKHVDAAALERIKLPLWIMGHSLTKKQRLPPLTPEVMYQAIRQIGEDYDGREVILALIDYIQIVPMSGGFRSRKERVDEALIELKQLAISMGLPFGFGAQASREVDKLRVKIPRPEHCQDTSKIEQTVDKGYGLWMPWLTEKPDYEFKQTSRDGKETRVPNSPDLLIIGMWKQRMEQGRFTWTTRFTPQELKLAEMELEQQAPLDF